MLVSAKIEGIRDRHLKKILEMKEGNKDKKLPKVIRSERRVKMAAKYG